MNSHRKPCVLARFFKFTLIGAAIVASASSLAAEHVKGQEACARLASHSFPTSLKLDVQKAVANETEQFCLVSGVVNARTARANPPFSQSEIPWLNWATKTVI